MKLPQLPALTGIRFFAASFVFFTHIPTLEDVAWKPAGLSLGFMGVALFFVLSGFILTYNYAGWFGHGVTPGAYGRFIWDRLAKIYPLYFLTLVLSIPKELVSHQRAWSWEALILQVTLMQSILPVNNLVSTSYFNVPGWSISCELFFYLLAPLMIWLALGKRRLAVTLIFGWLVALVVTAITEPWAYQVTAFWPGRFAPARTSEFMVGVITAVAFVKYPGLPKKYIQWCVAGGVILLVLAQLVPLAGTPLAWLTLGMLFAPGAALLIFGLAYGQGWLAQFFSHRWLNLLGLASFAFYLVHLPVILLFKGGFEYLKIKHSTPLAAVAVTVGIFVVAQIISILLFRHFEMPLQKYLRGLTRKTET